MSSARVPIPASDQTWLHMDRPNNLMHVHSMMWFDEEPALPDVKQVLQERMVDRFPVFQRCAVEHNGGWYWEDAHDFDLDQHISVTELDGDEADLRAWIGLRFSQPFEPGRPLWHLEMVRGVEGYGTVLFMRFHHALADGVRLTQLMLSLCDLVPGHEGSVPLQVGRGGPHPGLLATGAGVVRRGMGDAVDLAAGSLRIPGMALSALRPRQIAHALDVVLHPGRLIDLVETLASEDNESLNTVSELSRLMSAPPSVHTAWSGKPGVAKGVAWVRGLDLDRVKELGREHGGTVNDVLLALVSRSLTRYLEEHDALVDEIAWLVPMSLQPLDADLPADLGNHFSLIFMPMPLGLPDTASAIAAIRSRMARLKHSAEPIITFGVQWVVAESPRALSVAITNYFANKGVGVLTNVPGPRGPMTFAGVPVGGSLGWAPTSGNQPMSVCLFSYHGTVNVGIAADAGLVPDPDRIAELIAEEFEVM